MSKNEAHSPVPGEKNTPPTAAEIAAKREPVVGQAVAPSTVVTKRPTQKYAVLAIADRLEKQYLQGVGDIAVAEAVKALRKLAE